MIITEIYAEKYLHTYSDQKLMIRQNETGNIYEDAIDRVPCKFTYSETDIPIPEPEEEPS